MCNKIITNKDCTVSITNESGDFLENYVTFYVLLYNNEENPSYQIFVRNKKILEVTFGCVPDGYYIFCMFKLPLDNTQPYYYKDNKIYNGNNIISIEDFLRILQEINTEQKIQIDYYNFFQYCQLRKAYIKEALKIINEVQNSCDIKKTDSYIRDLLFSALNVIQYLVENGDYLEAQRIINRISGCNKLYNNSNNNCCSCGT